MEGQVVWCIAHPISRRVEFDYRRLFIMFSAPLSITRCLGLASFSLSRVVCLVLWSVTFWFIVVVSFAYLIQ